MAVPAEPRSPVAASLPAPASSEPEPELARSLAAAQERGWIGGDGADYFALFAPDAEVIASRSAEPDEHDVRFELGAYRALMRYQFAQAERPVSAFGSLALTFAERVETSAAGRRHLSQIRELRSLVTVERVHATFTFERRADGWRIVSLHHHPLSMGDTLYDADTLRRLDAAVDAAGEDLGARADALFFALRYAQAAPLFASLATAPDASADAWVTYGYCALFAGDADAAERAFARARQLDPWIVLPPP